MNKPPAFLFYVNDWLSSTKIALMTPAEEGAYIRLLCHAWADPQCSLSNDDAVLAVLSRLGEGWFKQSGEKIKGCFVLVHGRLVNERLKQEREKQAQWREKSRLGGINSGKSRKGQELGLKGGSSLVETKAEPKGDISSSLSRKKPPISPKGRRNGKGQDFSPDFLAFYEAYPLHVKKFKAFEVWQKIDPQNGLSEEILSALKRHRGSAQWQKENGKYIPHPSKWLSERRWEDEISSQEDWR